MTSSAATRSQLAPDALIQIMVDRIVQQFDPLRILIFGSRARGTATDESDVDLLIIFRELANKRRTAVEIRRALNDLPVSKDIVVATLDEIARRGHLVGSVLLPALLEGKVLYEQR